MQGAQHPGRSSICTQTVSIGASGLTRADLMLRLKRWLVAGLDDADWGTEDPWAEHVVMGGVYMVDAVAESSETECVRIDEAALGEKLFSTAECCS